MDFDDAKKNTSLDRSIIIKISQISEFYAGTLLRIIESYEGNEQFVELYFLEKCIKDNLDYIYNKYGEKQFLGLINCNRQEKIRHTLERSRNAPLTSEEKEELIKLLAE